MGRRGAGSLVVLAVDDEEPALDELTHLLEQHPDVGQVLRTTDAAEALRIVNASPGGGPVIDAVFVDVRMPGLDGLELARRCARRAVGPEVVFVTAQETRAVEAYEVGAVDYLLKPVQSERLGASLSRLRPARPPAVRNDDVIPVELAGSTTLVPRSTVRCVVAHGDYARLYTDSGSHLVRVPLAALEERWGGSGFVRVHRSYLVAMSAVTALCTVAREQVLELAPGPWPARVPVSRRRISAVRRLLRQRPGRASA